MSMSQEEVVAFLSQPRICAVATTRMDRAPHVVPVWYRYNGDVFTIWTQHERAWVENLARDPRVALSMQEEGPPWRAVMAHGRAELATGERAEILDEIRRITRIYVPEREVAPYIARYWPQLQTIVTITPEIIHTWKDESYSDEQ